MQDIWFVQQAQSLNLLSNKYKDRVLGNDALELFGHSIVRMGT